MTVTEEMRVAGFNYMSAADCPDVIANDVGGRFAGVEVAAVEQLERRAGGDRRKEGR